MSAGPEDKVPCHGQPQVQSKTPGIGDDVPSHGPTQIQSKQPRVQATSYTSHNIVCAAPTSLLLRWVPLKRSAYGQPAPAQYTVDSAFNPTRIGSAVTCPTHLKLKGSPTRHGPSLPPSYSRLQWRKENKRWNRWMERNTPTSQNSHKKAGPKNSGSTHASTYRNWPISSHDLGQDTQESQ